MSPGPVHSSHRLRRKRGTGPEQGRPSISDRGPWREIRVAFYFATLEGMPMRFS
jgi:hypothetical protein